MRVLIFHGYLLRGTGSNIYNAALARVLVELGHEVHLFCQDRHAEELPFVDGERCIAYRPDIGRVLPVYVADRYEDFDAVPFPELSDEQVEAYLEANVAAVRDVAERVRPEVALANHAVMGPAILARAIGGRVPYTVKIHGSALEYVVRRHRERFLRYMLEGLEQAGGVLVGSRHTAESLWELAGDPSLRERTRLGPPGVDIHEFRPRPRAEAARRLRELADRLESGEAAAWGGEPGAADALRALDPETEPIVSYVGKLIVSKGVDLLLAAWPLVVARVPAARLVVVGFGTYRDALRELADALAGGRLERAREIAARGRELEGGPPGELTYLAGFLDRLGEDGRSAGEAGTGGGLVVPGRDGYIAVARDALARVHWTGRLEHEDLARLLPACEVQVVPSTFPEAFGMVAAEAAACGVLPLSAAHSGLAEVTTALEPALDDELRPLLAFERGPDAVEQIAARLVSWLTLEPPRRREVAEALAALARDTFGWETVAQGVIAAAQGRLEELPEPPRAAEPSDRASG